MDVNSSRSADSCCALFFAELHGQKKGENLATKEDIGRITDEVERVKAQYANQLTELEHRNARFLEDLRSTQQLRMAAIERRLEVHQRAFALWRKLKSKTHLEAVVPIVQECQDFWNNNCLYLSPAAREAFNQAYFAALDHPKFLAQKGVPGAAAMVRENFETILKAGEAIVAGVELPTLGEREAKDVRDEQTRSSQSDVG